MEPQAICLRRPANYWRLVRVVSALLLLMAAVQDAPARTPPRRAGSVRPVPAARPAARSRRAKTPAVTISQEDWHGWDGCYRMSAGGVDVVVAPGIGGRIMEYSLAGDNALFVNRAEEGKLYPITQTWHNYGGFKNWNAPQDRWNWPPDPYLDYGAATVEILNGDTPTPTLRVTGAPSLATGLLFVRELTLDPSSGELTVRQRMVNLSDKPLQWSVWGIAQVPYPCVVALPLNPQSSFPGGVEALSDNKNGEGAQWHAYRGLEIARPAGLVGKFGIDDAGGWLAYFRDRLAYIQRIPALVPDAAYPDKGANAEVYTNGKALTYLEMEQLSPMFNLPPSASGELTETWQIRRLRHPVRTDADVAAAVQELGLTGMTP